MQANFSLFRHNSFFRAADRKKPLLTTESANVCALRKQRANKGLAIYGKCLTTLFLPTCVSERKRKAIITSPASAARTGRKRIAVTSINAICGDNLQAWLEQNARLPGNDCPQGKECEEKQ